jgi:pyruvate dehydrogenase E2 component (dihydrolipoamide acetyltransferase)
MPEDVPVLLSRIGGDDMESATLIDWLVESGSHIEKGDVIAQVETAKATVEIIAPAAGFLIRGEARPGDEIGLSTVIARIAHSHPVLRRLEAQPFQVQQGAQSEALSVLVPVPVSRATPSARRIARERGLDLSCIKAKGDTIVESDVLNHLAAKSVSEGARDLHASPGYRRSMALAMVESSSIPQFNVAMDCDGEALFAERQRQADAGTNVSVTDLVLLHVARVLARHATMRTHWDGAGPRLSTDVHIALAIATPHGLVAPVIRSADTLSLQQISAETTRLRSLATDRRLSVEDLGDACFTITNLGGYAIDDFTAVVSPGQGAILAVASFKSQPHRSPEGSTLWRRRARFRVSADHRVISGADAAAFLGELCTSMAGF